MTTTTTPTTPATAFGLIVYHVGGDLSPRGTRLREFAVAGAWDNFIVPQLAGEVPADPFDARRAAQRLLNLAGYLGSEWVVEAARQHPTGGWEISAWAFRSPEWALGERAELIVEFAPCNEPSRNGETYVYAAPAPLPPLPRAAECA